VPAKDSSRVEKRKMASCSHPCASVTKQY